MIETVGTLGMKEGAKCALRTLKRHPVVSDEALARYALVVLASQRRQQTLRLDPPQVFVANFCASFRYTRVQMARYAELVDPALLGPL